MKKRQPESWVTQFRALYDSAIEKFDNGMTDVQEMFSTEEKDFLMSIGCRPQELFDFVEDWCEVGEPSIETVIAITGVRREYFLQEQKSVWSKNLVSMNSLPSMGASLGGYAWLPRIIDKATAKLKGEMPAELMYGCGGDRPFLRKIGIEAGEFLRLVWESVGDHQKVLDSIQQNVRSPE